MKQKHKTFLVFTFPILIIINYFFRGQISEATAQNLITFFSIAFGFYITTIAVIFGSSYAHYLYKTIANDGRDREIHILRKYFKLASYWLLFSIMTIFILMIFGDKNHNNYLSFNLSLSASALFDPNLLCNAIILAISSINIFFMILIIHQILEALIKNAHLEQ